MHGVAVLENLLTCADNGPGATSLDTTRSEKS